MMRANVAPEDIVISAGSGLNSRKIAADIARILNLRYSELQTKVFPDGEIYVRVPVEDIAEKHVLYVQSTAPKKESGRRIPQNQSQSLIELFLTLDTFKEKEAKLIDVIVPYFAHARQDKEFERGEIVSTRTIAKILSNLGSHQLFTVDIHSCRETGPFLFGETRNFEGVRGYNITAARALALYIKEELKIKSPIVVIPDEGHRAIADKIKDVLMPKKVIFLHKKRIDERTVRFERIDETSLRGKNVIIFDDMISTGGTLIEASKIARNKGAKTIVAAVTHTLYVGGARERLLKSGVDKIIATDTIPDKDSVVPVAPIIAESLRQVLFGSR